MFVLLFFNQSIDVPKVAALLVVIKSVPYDEVVGYLHCHIFNVKLDFELFWFKQQRAYMY